MTDPLEIPFYRLNRFAKLPISWVVEFSGKGMDPLHAAWLASGDGSDMVRFIREYIRVLSASSVPTLRAWQRKTNEALARQIGIDPDDIPLLGLNRAASQTFTNTHGFSAINDLIGGRKAANAVRKVFGIDDVITLQELLAIPL